MSKSCNTKVKNPCKYCLQAVSKKNGLRCEGACQKWAHYKCLNYTPGKISDIKAGFIKVTCPCPDCASPELKEFRTNPPYTCSNHQCPANKPAKCDIQECPTNRRCPIPVPPPSPWVGCPLPLCLASRSPPPRSPPPRSPPPPCPPPPRPPPPRCPPPPLRPRRCPQCARGPHVIVRGVQLPPRQSPSNATMTHRSTQKNQQRRIKVDSPIGKTPSSAGITPSCLLYDFTVSEDSSTTSLLQTLSGSDRHFCETCKSYYDGSNANNTLETLMPNKTSEIYFCEKCNTYHESYQDDQAEDPHSTPSSTQVPPEQDTDDSMVSALQNMCTAVGQLNMQMKSIIEKVDMK